MSSLEARLSELSHTVGKYDREKEQDTLNIQLRATSSYCTSVASHTVGCVQTATSSSVTTTTH